MDRLSNKNKSNAPDKDSVERLSETRMNDGQLQMSEDIADRIYPNMYSSQDRRNTRFEDKKIVNNKPSQFGPIQGKDFHAIKK
jgi:hypothetical protein